MPERISDAPMFYESQSVEFLQLFFEILERIIDKLDFLCYNLKNSFNRPYKHRNKRDLYENKL